jgi:hypothetical protein
LIHETDLKPANVPTKEIIVLRTKLKPQEILDVFEKKKTSLFGSALRRPKPSEITSKSPEFFLEQIIYVSGSYSINFERDVSYTIKVDDDVTDVTIGNHKFPVTTASGVFKKFEKKMKEGVGLKKKNLEIDVTEHAVSSITDSFYLDCNGLETTFDYSTNSESIENFSQRILDTNKDHIRKVPIEEDVIFSKLAQKLKTNLNSDIQINSEDFIITEFKEIFIPIYEIKCYDTKNKAAVARIDALTGKLI